MYVVYLLSNGELLRSMSGPEEHLLGMLREGEGLIAGTGTWMTHRVVDGELVPLPERRQAPFAAAVWEPSHAEWRDPRSAAQALADEHAAQHASAMAAIEALERDQARPMREILDAQLAGRAAPDAAAAKLHDIDKRINLLRSGLARLT